jgi:hypothetical protein
LKKSGARQNDASRVLITDSPLNKINRLVFRVGVNPTKKAEHGRIADFFNSIRQQQPLAGRRIPDV